MILQNFLCHSGKILGCSKNRPRNNQSPKVATEPSTYKKDVYKFLSSLLLAISTTSEFDRQTEFQMGNMKKFWRCDG